MASFTERAEELLQVGLGVLHVRIIPRASNLQQPDWKVWVDKKSMKNMRGKVIVISAGQSLQVESGLQTSFLQAAD
ncbi:MAG TPA: hypothetical protein VNI77_11465 [Nitrososphaera sp.]|nr:hypothetical protein [Nitrososphaera sp.]